MDPYAQAKEELRDIDRRIVALQNRKAALFQFIELGDALFQGPPQAKSEPMITEAQMVGLVGLARTVGALVGGKDYFAPRQSTAKGRILEASKKIILANGPTPLRDLIPALEQLGVEIGAADKAGAVSALLSKSEDFKGDRKIGWSLIRPHEEKPPQGVDAPAGADLWASQHQPE